MIRLRILFLSAFLLAQYQVSAQASLEVYAESGIYISGDAVRLYIMPFSPGEERVDVTTLLVAPGGRVLNTTRHLITPLEKSGMVILPSDLETGAYKLISFLPGSSERNDLLIHVYHPSVFASALAPENANADLGPEREEPGFGLLEVRITSAGNQATAVIPPAEKLGDGIAMGLIKVVQEDLGDLPVRGISVPSGKLDFEQSFDVETISQDPNSRISFYFLNQGIVEEYYLADRERMYEGLKEHYGGGPVWAYQFDPSGNRMGRVKVRVERTGMPVFDAFSDVVPYNEKVREILESKRIRKFVDQVYDSESEPVVSIMEEEFDLSPDAIVRPSRYEGYATLREALASIVPKTQIIRRSGIYEARLSPSNSGFRYPENPLVLMDGVPIFGLDSLMEMPLYDIETIAVYNSLEKLRRFGTMGRFGALSITLKDGVENPLETYRSELPVFSGISDLTGGSPEFSSGAPDLRAAVHWDPSLRIRTGQPASIRWQMSDVPGEYVVWGLLYGSDGKPYVFSESFTYTGQDSR